MPPGTSARFSSRPLFTVMKRMVSCGCASTPTPTPSTIVETSCHQSGEPARGHRRPAAVAGALRRARHLVGEPG